MINRRTFIGTMAGGLLAAPLAAEGQQPGTVYRVGVLSGGAATSGDPLGGSKTKLRELGYIEGRNLVVERRYAEGKLDELPRLVTELLRAKVDLIVTLGTPATTAAKQATATIPVVFFLATDPVASGLVASLGRPGENLTGFAHGVYIGKQVEILREAVPRLSRVAYLHDSNYASLAPSGFDPLQRIGVRVEILNVKAPKDFDDAFAAASNVRVRGLVVEDSPMFYPHFSRIAQLAVQYRLPAISHTRVFPTWEGS